MGTGDQLLPILEGIALLAVCAALILASVARARSRGPSDRPVQVFWRGASQIAYVWAGVTGAVLVSSLFEIEGAPTMLWLVVALMVGAACLVILRIRWRRLRGFKERIARSPTGSQGR